MKYITFICLIFAISVSLTSRATEQEPDRLVINGDTMLLHALPLQQLKEPNIWKIPFFPDSLNSFSTGCWRGYIAFWEVIDNQLYLTDIYNDRLNAKADLVSLFGDKVYYGKVHANWFSDTVTAYRGKLLYYMHMGFSSIFEHEFEYSFEKGELKNSVYFDNSMSKNTPFIMEISNLRPTIDSLINWKALPLIDKTVRVQLIVEANESGQVDSVLEIHGNSYIFKQEALRVARSLTQLPVIYKRGKLLQQSFFLPFIFTREKQQQIR